MFFETKIKIGRMTEDGQVKKVAETYLVEAETFGDAENRIIEILSPETQDELEVEAIKRVRYSEIVKGEKDKWYSVKFAFITIDEKNGKEKRTHCSYLMNAESVENAREVFGEYMRSSMLDWEVKAVSETNVLDVYFL